jgi:hypothetical protein
LKAENPDAYATPPRATDEDEDAATLGGASDAAANEPAAGTADEPASAPDASSVDGLDGAGTAAEENEN